MSGLEPLLAGTGSLLEAISIFAIAMVRLGTALSIVPFLSSQLIQGTIRTSVIVVLTFVIYPLIALDIPEAQLSVFHIIILIIKEAFLGLLIGYLAGMVFWIVEGIGSFIDLQRGASMAQIFNPIAGEQVTLLSSFLTFTLITIFFVAGGFFLFLNAVFLSYAMWNPFSFYPELRPSFPLFFLDVVDQLMRLTITYSAPIIIILFLTDFTLGLINRFAQQLNVFFLSMSIKSVIAIFILAIYLPILFILLDDQFINHESLNAFIRGILS